MTQLHKTIAVCTALLWTAATTYAQTTPRYSVTDLGTLGGTESAAAGINNLGQIVGGADTAKKGKGPEFITNVFVWQNGRMRAVPGLDGSRAYVVAVNSRGQMAGAYSPQHLLAKFAAARFEPNGKARLIGSFPVKERGYSLSQADALNAKGQMGGVSNNQAFFWDGAKLAKRLPPPGFRTSEARAINDSGQAAGKADRGPAAATRTRALFWAANGKVTDLGVLPSYTDSVGRAMNNRGQVVGWVSAAGTGAHRFAFRYQAFVWENGKLRGLGSIPRIKDSKAAAINNKGQIVGNAYYKSDEAALLWQNGKVYELNKLVPTGSGWKLQNALGINDRGWIIGNGIHNGIRRGFVLKPR